MPRVMDDKMIPNQFGPGSKERVTSRVCCEELGNMLKLTAWYIWYLVYLYFILSGKDLRLWRHCVSQIICVSCFKSLLAGG